MIGFEGYFYVSFQFFLITLAPQSRLFFQYWFLCISTSKSPIYTRL